MGEKRIHTSTPGEIITHTTCVGEKSAHTKKPLIR